MDASLLRFGTETKGSSATSVQAEVENQQYEQLLADIWVGVLLSLILLSCVCCMCTCLIYHKFQKWKRFVLQDGENPEILTVDISANYDCESLPSYTVASGLPSYEEALQQLESVKKLKNEEKTSRPPLCSSPSRVSLLGYIQSLVNEKN